MTGPSFDPPEKSIFPLANPRSDQMKSFRPLRRRANPRMESFRSLRGLAKHWRTNFFDSPAREPPDEIFLATSPTREAPDEIFPTTSRTREPPADKSFSLRGHAEPKRAFSSSPQTGDRQSYHSFPVHQRENEKQGRLFATCKSENHESAVLFVSPTWKVIRKSFSSHSPICRTLQVSFFSGFQNGERQKSRLFVILHLEKSILAVVFRLTDLENGKNVAQTRFTNLWSSTQRPFLRFPHGRVTSGRHFLHCRIW